MDVVSASFIGMGVAAVGVVVEVVVVVSLSLFVVVGLSWGAVAGNWVVVVVSGWLGGGPVRTASAPCPNQRPDPFLVVGLVVLPILSWGIHAAIIIFHSVLSCASSIVSSSVKCGCTGSFELKTWRIK